MPSAKVCVKLGTGADTRHKAQARAISLYARESERNVICCSYR
jgi:hypothetical protein